MTYSRQPWSARTVIKYDENTRDVHELLDVDGRVIARFNDARDMDLVTGGFPTREDVAALTDELNDALAERDDEARAANAARATLEAVAKVLEDAPPLLLYVTPLPWFPDWIERTLETGATLRVHRTGASTRTVARFESVSDLDYVVHSIKDAEKLKAIAKALNEGVVTPVSDPNDDLIGKVKLSP